ncbi:hypothetical protein G6F56_004945 [Rhizopus delemar]|nr:hypothetical protein G6F56_004945 [Rhizopus delemar]
MAFDLKEINECFEYWFTYASSRVKDKKASNCVFKINMHQLSHLSLLIKEGSNLCAVSAKSMERAIGSYKKKSRARVNNGENTNNIIERVALYNLLRNTKMLAFENPKKKTNDLAHTFVYHPLHIQDPNFPQLWAPFYQSFQLNSSDDTSLCKMSTFTNALKEYKKRLYSLTASVFSIQLDTHCSIKPAGKLWSNSSVLSSTIFTKNISTKFNKRGGEYVLFNSTRIVKR